MSDEVSPARRPANGNGDDRAPCEHGSYEVMVRKNSEPVRLICADCGREWGVSSD